MKLIKGNIVKNAATALKVERLMRDGYVPYHGTDNVTNEAKEASIPSSASTRRKKKKVEN